MIGAWGKQQRGGKRMLICVCLKQFPLLFSCSVVSDPLWPRTAAHHTSLPFTNFQELAQTHVHWVDDSIQPSHPLSSPLPMSSVFPGIRVFFNESGLLQWVGSSPVSWVFSNESGLLQWVGSSPMSWVFTSGGQSIGASASASVLTMNIQDWFPLGLTGLISVLSKRL